MELRAWAERILLSELVADKLAPITETLTDEMPGPPIRLGFPARPPELRFEDNRHGADMPHMRGMAEPRLRAIAHHIMANHELQALEVMAWTLLAFPEAPGEFRSGIVHVMRDEQRHTLLHLRRLEAMGLRFGDKPVNGHVWRKVLQCSELLDYLACLPLTFEGGNLDHTLEFAQRFDEVGDRQSAQIMRAIHRDEIEHVAFGLHWLRQLKPAELSDWETYVQHLRWPLQPQHAKGKLLDRASRLAAGMTPEFIDELEKQERGSGTGDRGPGKTSGR